MFKIEVHVKPFTRRVQSGNLQASSFNTASGAEAERIQRMFSLLSSSVQPCSFGLGTLGLASKQRLQIAAWKLALCACRKRQSLHGGSWLESAAPLCTEKLVAQLVPILLHRPGCNLRNGRGCRLVVLLGGFAIGAHVSLL